MTISRMIESISNFFDRLFSPGFMLLLCIGLVLYAGYMILAAFGG